MQKVDKLKIGLLKWITYKYLIFLMKVVRSRPRQVHHHFNIKIQYRTKMMSSEGINKYKDKVDERPFRVEKRKRKRKVKEVVLMEYPMRIFQNFWGIWRSSNASILGFTEFHHRKGGGAILHPAFSEEAVRDLCTRVLGRRYKNIFSMNQMDFLIEFKASDNPMLFAIKLGNTHTWLGMELTYGCPYWNHNDVKESQ